jgi:hypothetical protein
VLGIKVLKHSGQETGIKQAVDLRDLHNLKKEIRAESNRLKPILVNEIKKDVWPMLKHSKRVQNLVMLKQRYLALLSSKYNLRSTQVESQILS